MSQTLQQERAPAARLIARGKHITPMQAYDNKKPDISHLRLIGCDAWLAIGKEHQGQKKLSDRGVKCKLLGYAGTNQYRLYNPVSGRVIVARDVEFDESPMLRASSKAYHWDGDLATSRPEDLDWSGAGSEDDSEAPLASNGTFLYNNNSLSPGEEIALQKTLNELRLGGGGNTEEISQVNSPDSSTNPSGIHNDIGSDGAILHPDPPDDATIVERDPPAGPSNRRPQSRAPASGSNRPSRNLRPSQKASQNERWQEKTNWGTQAHFILDSGYYEDLLQASEQAYCRQVTVLKAAGLDHYDHDFDPDGDLRDLIELACAYSANAQSSLDEEPLNYKEAMAGPYAKEFKEATNTEMLAHKKMGTYIRVKRSTLPPGTRILSSRMVYKIKKDLKGQILKFKARWCARGFEQSYGVNFHDTYASVVKSMSYKALFAIIAKHDLEAEQMDIVTAFLNALLKEVIYIEPPEGYEEPEYCWRLHRALYGLKQSPREWYDTLSSWLTEQGFIRLESDHSVFVNRRTKLVVPIYVDDLLIIGPNGSSDILRLKQALSKRFQMTDLGPCHHYLGMEVTRDRHKKTLHLSQGAYVDKILKRFGLENCNKTYTPMESGTRLVSDPGSTATVQDVKLYQAKVGSLIYLSTQTRFDITFAVQGLSRFNLRPGQAHMAAVKHVLRYLKGTKDWGITYGGASSEASEDLLSYTDADYGGDLESRRSTGAYIFKLYGGAFSWSSKLQNSVALSSCEAEYMAQTQASKEAIWITRLLGELDLGFGLPGAPVTIKADNQGAIALSEDPKFHSRSKHIDIQWHFVREKVKQGAVRFEYCPTADMAADGLTKALNKVKFARFLELAGLRPYADAYRVTSH